MSEFKPDRRTFLVFTVLLALNEVLSFASYLIPELNTAVFLLLVLVTFILTWSKLEHGLLFLFAELFVGGKGYLYSLTIGEARVSIRIALFVVVMLVWFLRRRYRRGSWEGIARQPRRWLMLFGVIVAWAIIAGTAGGHGTTSVFFDANAYLFFALILVLSSPFLNWRELGPRMIALIAAAATILGIKSLLSLGLFVKLQVAGLKVFYRWIRETGVGEVAPIFGGTYRVFFQSQIYGLFGLSVLAPFVLPRTDEGKKPLWLLMPITLGLAAILVSLSRSFWVGAVASVIVLVSIGLFRYRWRPLELGKVLGTSLVIFALAFTLTSWALNFPYPFPRRDQPGGASLLSQRIASLGGEAAAKSRGELLRALLPVVGAKPFFGYGFGKTVTYQSSDPRQLESQNRGIYTTYAFELGYLDMAVKFGIVGLGVFLALLASVIVALWKTKSHLAYGFLIGTMALAVIHLTTPYLNHPLGIGFLLLAATFGLVEQRRVV